MITKLDGPLVLSTVVTVSEFVALTLGLEKFEMNKMIIPNYFTTMKTFDSVALRML